MGGRDRADHVGEPGTLGAGRRGHLAGHANEAVRRRAHGALRTPAIGWNARIGHRRHNGIIAGAAEQRAEAFFLADLGKQIGPLRRKLKRLDRRVLEDLMGIGAGDGRFRRRRVGARCAGQTAGRGAGQPCPHGGLFQKIAPARVASRTRVVGHGLSPPRYRI